ncbi:MAG: alpha/beta hydrolase, partial [Gemmatimonadetes bacterium]|nr:alpha/beta hydrolase [Gemmatimonadota bacterium]
DFYVELLTDRLRKDAAWDVPRRIVVAHSFGGMLALQWWLAHQGRGLARVDGMVLIATTAGPMYDVARLRIARLGALEWRIPVKRIARLWNRPVVTVMMKRLLSGGLGATPVDFQTLPSKTDVAVDVAGWRNTDWRAMRSFRLALFGFDVRNRLAEIGVPAMVLHGTDDLLFPAAVGRALSSGLLRGELRLVPQAGHALPLTHGEEVRRAVSRLCALLPQSQS